MRRLPKWEGTLVILLVLAGLAASLTSPFYLTFDQISYSLQQSVAVVGLIALGLMAVVVIGEIDISLPAIMALGNIMFAQLSQAAFPVWLAFIVVVAACALCGCLNGLLVVLLGLPSLAITLGAMGAYRALALLLGGQSGFAAFQRGYFWLGSSALWKIPVSLILLVAAAVCLGLVMQCTVFGRALFASGLSARAAMLSGIRVRAVKVAAFAIAGAMSGLASLVYIGEFQSARADNASDMLLFIVTAVVLGGVDIFGGRGNTVGVMLSLLLLGTLENGMGLGNVPGSVQTLVIGSLLIVSVLIANGDVVSEFRSRRRQRER